jgi:hypothetical protein
MKSLQSHGGHRPPLQDFGQGLKINPWPIREIRVKPLRLTQWVLDEIWIKMLDFSGLNGVFRAILTVFGRREKCSKIFQKRIDASLRLCQSEDTHGN